MIPLIFYYHRLNCYSFNALAGALDADPWLARLPVDIAKDEQQLRTLAAARARRGRAIAALSILTCQFEHMRQVMRRLRSECGPQLTILAGGPHATAHPGAVLEAGADAVFVGEAETTFPQAVRTIIAGGDLPKIHASAGMVELDAFCSFSPSRGMYGPVEITRGCVFACAYCQTSRIFGTQLRHRSIENIVRQAESLRSVNRRVVRLLSPNAFSYGSADGRQLNCDAIRGLLSALRSRLGPDTKILFAHFPSEVRPEHVTAETLELLKQYADNDEIVIGAQSGSRRILEACSRSHDVESVLQAVALARKRGYKVIVDFIFGLPGETDSDLRQSVEAMEEIVRMGGRIHPHIFAPLPQTPFADEPAGRLSPELREVFRRLNSRRGIYGDCGLRIADCGLP